MIGIQPADSTRRVDRKSTSSTSPVDSGSRSPRETKPGEPGALLVLPGEDPQEYRNRLAAWAENLHPSNPIEAYLVERAARFSWQLDRADRAQVARLSARARQARADDASDEHDEVAALAHRLFWDPRGPISVYPHFEYLPGQPRVSRPESSSDPDQPARLVLRLEGTAGGCRWMLGRWTDLGRILENGMKWQSPDRLRAIRLLGKQPLDAADDDQVLLIYLSCFAMDPKGPDAFGDLWNELTAGEADLYRRRLMGRELNDRVPKKATEAKATLLGIVGRATHRLESLLSLHLEREQADAADQNDGLAFDDSESGERLRRYQLSCGRTLLRTLEMFRILRGAGEENSRGRGERAQPVGDAQAAVVVKAQALPAPGPPDTAQAQEFVGPPSPHSALAPASVVPGSPDLAQAPFSVGRESPHPACAANEGLQDTRSVRRGHHGTGGCRSFARDQTPRNTARSSGFPRTTPQSSVKSEWPARREDGSLKAAGSHGKTSPETTHRRRVGGYEVPLDTSVPVSDADRAPVRLRSRRTTTRPAATPQRSHA